MKVLFAGLHLAYFRNFESVVRELAARGHHVHLTAEEPERMGGQQLAERLAEHPNVTWDMLPLLEREPWFDAARSMRVALDYVRVLEPRYASKLRLRAEERTARAVRWVARIPVVGRSVLLVGLKQFERLMPSSPLLEEYLRRHAPDVVVLASLTYSRSQQFDVLKASRTLRIPVAAAIMSWDHLSSKALLHVAPDMVLVWNDVQKREAVEMHALPADRVVLTGAQCYDQWFTRTPERDRAEFCRVVGLRPDRPFVLWVHSALSPTPDPPEPALIMRWIEALRTSDEPRLRELGVLVRPHPERMKEWAGITLDRFDNVAFHGRNPIDNESKNDYFDSLYYSHAVVGLVTSAFLEAAIVGRPVLTFTLPEYRMHQEEMTHFQYLTQVEGGLLHRAEDFATHLQQLAAAVGLEGARDERNQRFLGAFVRPFGLDVAATSPFVDALERLREEGARPAGRAPAPWLVRAAAAMAAACSQSGVGRWLFNDRRDDERDERREATEAAVRARIDAWRLHKDKKAKRNRRLHRRAAVTQAAKKARSAFRRARARTMHLAHRALFVRAPAVLERFGKTSRGLTRRTTHRVGRLALQTGARLLGGARDLAGLRRDQHHESGRQD